MGLTRSSALILVEKGPHVRRSVAKPESDGQLMEQIGGGHRGSLRILMGRYWAPLVGYAAGVLDSRDDAEDVVQETFVQVWRRRRKWSSHGAVNGYLRRITRNLALNVRRDRAARRRREKYGGRDVVGTTVSRSPVLNLEGEMLRREVEAAIAALSQRRRQVFVLSRFHGRTHGEIAESLELSPQTVANHMNAALSELREALSQHLTSD